MSILHLFLLCMIQTLNDYLDQNVSHLFEKWLDSQRQTTFKDIKLKLQYS